MKDPRLREQSTGEYQHAYEAPPEGLGAFKGRAFCGALPTDRLRRDLPRCPDCLELTAGTVEVQVSRRRRFVAWIRRAIR